MIILLLLAQTACAAPTKPLVVDTARFVSVDAEHPRDTLYAHGDTVWNLVKGSRTKVVRQGNVIMLELTDVGVPTVTKSFCLKDDRAYLVENGSVSSIKYVPAATLFFVQELVTSTKRVQGMLSRVPR